MSDIGKAWVDGVREPSYTEIESRIHHQKYSELMSNEFDERVKMLAPLLDHPRDGNGGLWISAFDFESRANRRNSHLAKKAIETLNSFVPPGKELLMAEGYYFTLQAWGGRHHLQLHHKMGAFPLFYLETGDNKQAYLTAENLATLENLLEKYKDGVEGYDADDIKKTFNFKA